MIFKIHFFIISIFFCLPCLSETLSPVDEDVEKLLSLPYDTSLPMWKNYVQGKTADYVLNQIFPRLLQKVEKLDIEPGAVMSDRTIKILDQYCAITKYLLQHYPEKQQDFKSHLIELLNSDKSKTISKTGIFTINILLELFPLDAVEFLSSRQGWLQSEYVMWKMENFYYEWKNSSDISIQAARRLLL